MRSFLLALLIATAALPAANITSAGIFSTSNTGAYGGAAPYWNTQTDTIFNLYLTQANTGLDGAFANTGDGAQLPVNLSFISPGSYTYHFFADGASATFLGLNLFFDGVTSGPGISVSPHPAGGAFAATGQNTPSPDGSSLVPGANTTVFTSGGQTVTLTAFQFFNPADVGLPVRDRVSPFNSTASGSNDLRGFFTLEVTNSSPNPIPEPSTYAMLLLGVAGVAVAKSRGKK